MPTKAVVTLLRDNLFRYCLYKQYNSIAYCCLFTAMAEIDVKKTKNVNGEVVSFKQYFSLQL